MRALPLSSKDFDTQTPDTVLQLSTNILFPLNELWPNSISVSPLLAGHLNILLHKRVNTYCSPPVDHSVSRYLLINN